MAGDTITLSDLQSVFGKPFFDQFKESQRNQVQALDKLQTLVGDSFSTITTYLEKVNSIVEAVKALQQPSSKADEGTDKPGGLNDIKTVSADRAKSLSSSSKVIPVYAVNDSLKDVKKEKKTDAKEPGLLANLVSGMFGKKESKKTFIGKKNEAAHDTVNIEFTPKTKVMLEDILDSELLSFYHKLETPLNEIQYILKDILNNTAPKKEKPKSILDYLGDLAMMLGPILGPLLLMLGGAAASIAGIAALISGLTDSGPLKGLKKLLGRGGLALGLSILKKGAVKLSKAFGDLAKLFFGEKVIKGFTTTVSSAMKKFGSRVTSLRMLFFKRIEDALLKVPRMAIKYVKDFFGVGTKAVGSMTKGLGMKGGKGIINTLFKGIGKLFSKNVLKRIPIIGTILGLSFAYSRFKKGDIIGGIIDVASALATMIPGIGTALSIGLDVLNAFLDVKSGGADAKANTKKLDIFKDIFAKIGKGIMSVIDSILVGIVDMIPEWGGLRSIAVKSLKSMGIDIAGIKESQAKEAEEEKIKAAKATSETKPPSAKTETNENSTPSTQIEASVEPKELQLPSTAEGDNEQAEKLGDVHETVKSQNDLIAQMLTFSKQTAENTNALVTNFAQFKENAGKTIQMNNINNSQNFSSGPASSTDFRSSMKK